MATGKLKGNLYSLDNGYYISRNDPLFWKKLLIQRPDDKEALYHVGLEYEVEAGKYLERYNLTKNQRYLAVYHKLLKQSFDMLNRSFNKGYLPARLDVLRLEQAIKPLNAASLPKKSPLRLPKWIAAMIAVLILILGILVGIAALTGKFETITNNINNHYVYMIPYEVIEQKPEVSTAAKGMSAYPEIIIVNQGISKEDLVNKLVGGVKTAFQRDPLTSKQILAIDNSKTERGMACWAGGDRNIQVYIYPQDDAPFGDRQERQLWETATVLRSATYQFYRQNGHLPEDLRTLIQPFPNNYLTELPKDPYKLNRQVAASFTGEGGWQYSPPDNPQTGELISLIKETVKPNLGEKREIPFSPLRISIDKSSLTLSVTSGDQLMRRYQVALGKENSTPEGDLFISRKVMNPDKLVPLKENVYGTRAMELANLNFAIHGTNSPASIGQEVSQGCIRLNNADMEELYAIIPLYTPVKIEKNPVAVPELAQGEANPDLYNLIDNPLEEDNLQMYHWAH